MQDTKESAIPTQDDPYAGFDGHIPKRRKPGVEIRIVDRAEFLTRLEPRTVGRTGPGTWASHGRYRPGEPTEHEMRMRLLEQAREARQERAAGVSTTKRGQR